MVWNFSPLEVYSERVRERLSDEFVYREPLRLEQLMNLILRGELPSSRVVNLSRELPRRKGSLSFETSERRREILVEEFPGFISRMDNFLGLETDTWREQIRESSERYFMNTPIERISNHVEGELRFSELKPELEKQILENFLIRKYKLEGTVEWRLEDFFDNLRITSQCRQIVLVKPLENKAMYKLSNDFSDHVTFYHSKTPLINMPSRERKTNNYITLTLSKYERSKDVALVIIEEIPSRQRSKSPQLKITIEIPGEKRLGSLETDGAYGTTVVKYFQNCILDPGLLALVEGINYRIFDLQLFTRTYDLESVRHYLLDLSIHPVYKHVLFSQHRNKVDDQKFVFRGLSPLDGVPGSKKVIIDIQSKGILFRTTQTSDLFDVYDILTILLSYGRRTPSLNFLGIPGEDKSLDPIDIPKEGEEALRMDVVEKIGDGEYILREAIFFDSHFTDVCNKPNEKDILRGGELSEDFGFFPPESLVRKIESEGRFRFPKYESQRVKVKLNYRTSGKDYILGKRKIPKAVRDSMAAKGNYAFIFDFFPCKKEGRGLGVSDWGISAVSGDDVKADYVLDENKDEILPGRFAKVQLNFFDSLRSFEGQILRTGVKESKESFLEASAFASKTDRDFRQWLSSEVGNKILVGSLPQFPDISDREFQILVSNMLNTFADSKYFIRLVEEYVNRNIVVMNYVEKKILEYALYETPHGAYPPDIFDHLSRNIGRKTLVLLRRSYEFLPDQYDVLVEASPDMKRMETEFDTERVIRFLRGKISLADIDVYSAKNPESVSLIDLSSISPTSIPETRELDQVTDSLGARSATTYVWNETLYPCMYMNPGAPNPNLPVKPLYEFLVQKRPSVYDLFKGGSPWKKYPVTGVGITSLYKKKYVTSVFLEVGVQLLCLLVSVTPYDQTMKNLFAGKPEMETPDPYISNQFRETEYRFNDVLFRRAFGGMLVGLLLKVLFVEFVEKMRREGPVFDRVWRDGLLKLVSSGEKNLETVELKTFYYIIRDVKKLRGFLPQNPIRQLSSMEYLGKFFDGHIRCFSRGMYEKLYSQVLLFEKILPTIPELQGLGGVPAFIYKTDIYDSTAILIESPGSVTGIEPDLKTPNQYNLWQIRSQTSLEKITLYDSLLPEFFETDFTLSPLIGFYGSKGTGLWSIRPPMGTYNQEMGVVKTTTKLGSRSDIPKIAYVRDSETIQVGAYEDEEDKRVLVLERVL